MPDIGEGLTEAEIVAWLVAVGEVISVGQSVVEVETAKTSVEIPATHAGVVLSLVGEPGDTVEVGDVLFVVGVEGEHLEPEVPAQPSESAGARTRPTAHMATETGSVRAMPAVRRLARDRGVDLATIEGTGQGGSITRDDVEAAADSLTPGPRREALSATRRAIAAHMAESWRSIPHVTVQAEVRAERLLERRITADGRLVPLEAVIAESVIPLLARHPWFNAAFVDDEVAIHDVVHLGFAVDTEAGLMVVVVRDADRRSTEEIGTEFTRLAEQAVDRSIAAEDVTGQTFTISNIGALGGGHGTPIIPLGTSAIVSIGRAEPRAVVEGGAVAVGLVAPLDLSYDHRLIDGGAGQRFLADLVSALEA